MDCLQAEESFSAHLEDTLDYQTLQRFEGHLTECDVCRHEYARFQESVKAVQELPQIAPSPYFMATLQQRLATEQRESVSSKESGAIGWRQVLDVLLRPKWAFTGIMILILAAAGTYFYQDLRPTPVSLTPQVQQIEKSPGEPRIGLPPLRRNGSQFLQGSTISTPGQPTRQRYMLKQVSYTNASTSGGL